VQASIYGGAPPDPGARGLAGARAAHDERSTRCGGKMEPVQAPSSSSPGPLELSTSLSLLSCRSSGEVRALDAGGEHPANCVNRVCGGPAAPGRRHYQPAVRAVLVRVRHHQAGTSRLASRQAAATTTRSSTRLRGADGGVAYFLSPAAAAMAGYTAWPSLRPPSPSGDLLVVPGDGAAPAVCSSGTGMVFLDSLSLFPSTFDFLHLYSGVTSPWIDFSI
jgi:hypothetical protein